jgi:hypothetical protein
MAQSRRQRNRLDVFSLFAGVGTHEKGLSQGSTLAWPAMQLGCTFHMTFNGAIAMDLSSSCSH